MDDRTLLEAAAKAAGMQYVWLGGMMTHTQPDATALFWRPLEDDGDALRLAVQCGIGFSVVDDEPGRDGRESRACAEYIPEATDDPCIRYVFEDHRGDLFAATRRAIVRAAAAMTGSELMASCEQCSGDGVSSD